jgi:pimeloyl-ACP methyl ester carboxylesterase
MGLQTGSPEVHTMPKQGRRSWRYYLLVLILIAWGVGFLLTASIALTQLSPLAFLGAGLLLYLGLVLRNVYRSLNPMRTPVLSNPLNQIGVKYQDVVFPSQDGWPLSGWFIPPTGGPTIILTHGMGGNRLDLMPTAALMIENGFGILMYDMRCHGRSAGELGTWGWLEVNDLQGAVDFLLERREVDKRKIGALGFSLGGQVSLRAAAANTAIRAVVAEDPSPAVFADHLSPGGNYWWNLINRPGVWLVYQLLRIITGLPEPEGITQTISEIFPRPIFIIASGVGRASDLMQAFYQQALEPKDFWHVPDAGHGWIAFKRQEEYQKRVCGFFRKHLNTADLIEYT